MYQCLANNPENDFIKKIISPFLVYPYQPLENNEQKSFLIHIFNEKDRLIHDKIIATNKEKQDKSVAIDFLNCVVFFLQANTSLPKHTFLSHEEVAKNLNLSNYMAQYTYERGYVPKLMANLLPTYTFINDIQYGQDKIKNPTLLLAQLLDGYGSSFKALAFHVKEDIKKYPTLVITDSNTIIILLKKYVSLKESIDWHDPFIIFETMLQLPQEIKAEIALHPKLSIDLQEKYNFFNLMRRNKDKSFCKNHAELKKYKLKKDFLKKLLPKKIKPESPIPRQKSSFKNESPIPPQQSWFKKMMTIKGLFIASSLFLMIAYLLKNVCLPIKKTVL
jgi:hypothetical protein